jgi:hypothetical protein
VKLKSTLTLVALAFAAAGASATTVTDWGTIGPAGMSVHADTQAPGAIDDVYNFTIGGASDVFTYSKEFESLDVSMLNPSDPTFVDPTFTLYSGTYDGTTFDQVGQSFTFAGDVPTTTTYASLASGDYFFEIKGTATGTRGSDYDFAAFANNPSNPLPAVPEPANVALMLAGAGLIAFMSRRRNRQ